LTALCFYGIIIIVNKKGLDLMDFLILTILCTLVLGCFVGGLLTSQISNNKTHLIAFIIISLVVGFLFSLMFSAIMKEDEKKWNNGICSECGSEWELFDVEYTRNGGEYYYYKCENNHVISTNGKMN
jgi:uncharacterized membrane protein YfcA